MVLWNSIRKELAGIGNIFSDIDTGAAARNIRNNIFFRGPNVWILAFSTIIASVGLNVNSTAVIIGAMLISPLMGPIIGLGLSLGTNDMSLLKDSWRNLLVMVLISLIASFLFFLLSPLNLANPTELEARTSPSIYDVIIAFFGGLAGILEQSRKEKGGTVISGVAIATALMPPLCTAGYGLAKGMLPYFFGAMGLFLINTIFITIATYIATIYLRFPAAEFADAAKGRQTQRMITIIVVLVTIPSIFSAVMMVRANNFIVDAEKFVNEHRHFGRSYIYDYQIQTRKGHSLSLFMAGESISAEDRLALYSAASEAGIKPEEIIIRENGVEIDSTASSENSAIMKGIFERAEQQLRERDEKITFLEEKVRTLSDGLPYTQLTKEITTQYPQISEVYITRGAGVTADSLHQRDLTLIYAFVNEELPRERLALLTDWLKIRLQSDVTVITQMNK